MSSAIDTAAAPPPPASLRLAYPSAGPAALRTGAFTPVPPAPAAAPVAPARPADQSAAAQPAGAGASVTAAGAAPDVGRIVDNANSSMAMQNRSLRFRVNPEIDDIQIQILDSSRDKVIRSIPSEDMVAIAARMRDLSGIGAQIDVSR